MQGIYLLSVWLHIMAAVAWVGGTLFLVIVLIPAIRRPEFGGVAAGLIRFTALRFRWVSWACFCIFIVTGVLNLAVRGIGLKEFQDRIFWQGSFGRTLAIKLSFVLLVLLISAFHDFFLGPRAAAARSVDAHCSSAGILRRNGA